MADIQMNAGLFAIQKELIFCPCILGPARGPPTSGAPPVSAPQTFNQYSQGQGDMQNGPPRMTQAPAR